MSGKPKFNDNDEWGRQLTELRRNWTGMTIPAFVGLYDPIIVILLFVVAFLVGILLYGLTAKVRYDDVYVGGMPALEKFRIAGTEFYNEVRNFTLLK